MVTLTDKPTITNIELDTGDLSMPKLDQYLAKLNLVPEAEEAGVVGGIVTCERFSLCSTLNESIWDKLGLDAGEDEETVIGDDSLEPAYRKIGRFAGKDLMPEGEDTPFATVLAVQRERVLALGA